MEIVKKKISLEAFKSRIPALLETIDGNTTVSGDGSWGKIPCPVVIFGKELKYGTLMNFYYNILDVIRTSSYYEYDASGDKWLADGYDWREVFYTKNKILYTTTLPTSNLNDRMIVGITSSESVTLMNEVVGSFFGNDGINGVTYVTEVNKIIGKIITPSNCIGAHVPYFMYVTDIPDYITFMDQLLSDTTKNCCYKERYEEYGGTIFHDFLKEMNARDWQIYQNPIGTRPTLDIPLLLTSKIVDLGQFQTYNVDEYIVENEESNITKNNKLNNSNKVCSFCGMEFTDEYNHDNCHSTMVKCTAESKLNTLKKKRVSTDDNGAVLPGIYNPQTKELDLQYKVGYIKNIQIVNDNFYGDVIVDTIESCDIKEVTELQYETIKSMCKTNEVKEGDTENPIDNISSKLIKDVIEYGNYDMTFDDVKNFILVNSSERLSSLRGALGYILKNEYPNIYSCKQGYEFIYNTIFSVEKYVVDENNTLIVEKVPSALTQTVSGHMYISFTEPKIEFTYVLGGKLQNNNGALTLNETSPFPLQQEDYESWEGSGIWYRESYPVNKLCCEEFLIDGIKQTFIFDKIDFESQMKTYSYPGIDFKRKNYILCRNVRYKSDTYHTYSTTDPIFRDGKTLGVSIPIKEKYDVTVDRGKATAFEKHLQLSEIKSWQDLENYRNGMFLNK